MRTTVRLPDELYAEVRRQALEHDMTVTGLLEAALREKLERWSEPAGRPFQVRPFTETGGLRPGVDINDNAGLLDIMERSNADT